MTEALRHFRPSAKKKCNNHEILKGQHDKYSHSKRIRVHRTIRKTSIRNDVTQNRSLLIESLAFVCQTRPQRAGAVSIHGGAIRIIEPLMGFSISHPVNGTGTMQRCFDAVCPEANATPMLRFYLVCSRRFRFVSCERLLDYIRRFVAVR